MARVGDASASSVVTADVVTPAAPIEGYMQYGKLAPGDLLDNHHPVATIHDGGAPQTFRDARGRRCRFRSMSPSRRRGSRRA